MQRRFLPLLLVFSVAFFTAQAQNTFPSSGNVGIGTTSPLTLLQVKGVGAFGNRVTTANATRALNLADTAAVMRILRVSGTNAPAVELISRTTSDGANVAYWDMYAEPSDKSFRIRDRTTGSNLDRITVTKTGDVGIGTTTPGYQLHVEGGTANAAVYGNTNGTYGLYGKANLYGVYGTSKTYGVYGDGPTYGVYGNSTGSGVYGAGGSYGVEGFAPGGQGFGYGVYGHSSYTGVTGSGNSYGVSGYCQSTSSGFGVYGQATDNASGIGVYGQGYYGVKAVSSTLYGVDGTGYYIGVIGHGSTSNSTSYGVEGYGVYQGGYFAGSHLGVQGYASTSSSSNYGVYGSGNGSAYAGYFSGTVFATTYTGSDRKLKKNIEDVSTAMNIINQLHPKMYEFRQDGGYQYMHLPEGKHYGLVAQELEQVLPGLVKDTKFDTRIELEAEAKAKSNGEPSARNASVKGEVIDFKAVNYTELTPILIKAVQELGAQNSDLKAENDGLKKQVEDMQARLLKIEALLTKSSTTSVSLSSAYLEAPVPNPSNGNALIKYHLPASTGNSRLVILDAKGSVVKQVSISGNSSQLNVNTSGLSAGAYTCTLYVDGVQADSKTMMVGR